MSGLEFAPIVFGLTSAACWGAGDFCGGLATKSTQVYRVVISSQIISLILLLILALAICQGRPQSFTNETARAVPGWLRDGVIYELFPRNFSPEGNFNGVTAKLDELKDLGINIIWLMPIHPQG